MHTETPPEARRAARPPSGDGPGGGKKKRFRVLRVILKTLLWTIAVVVLLVGLAFLFIQTPPGKALIRNIVVGILNDTFRGRIEVDEITGFLPFDAEVHGFRLYDPDGKMVLNVERVATDFHPLELLDNVVHLSDATIDRPTLDVFDPQGRVALLRAFEPRTPSTDTTPSPWTIRFEGVHLTGGRVQNLAPGEDATLADLDVKLSLELPPGEVHWTGVEIQARPVGRSELVAMLGGNDPNAPGSLVVKTTGKLANDEVALDDLEALAGEHAVVLKGSAHIADPIVADLDIVDLRVALDRLPAAIRDQIVRPEDAAGNAGTPGDAAAWAEGAEIQGKGHLGIDPAGEASVDLTLGTPYGLAALQGGATVRVPGSPALNLQDWAATFDLADATPPPAIRARLPEAARGARADLRIEAFGHGSPMADDGRVHVELSFAEHAPHEGRLGVTVTRVEDDPRDHAKTFQLSVAAEALDLQPWIGVAGEPELIGEIGVLVADGSLALPDIGLPRVALAASFDASASGRIRAIDKVLSAPFLGGSANIQYDGSGAPIGRIDLAGVDLGFDIGGVEELALGFDIRGGSDGVPEVSGKVTAKGARWDQMSIATLELPLDLVLTGFGVEGATLMPSGDVSWRATGVDLGAQTIASTSGELHVSSEERGGQRGIRIKGVARSGKLDLGPAVNAGVAGADLGIDTWLGPGADGAMVGGAITARVNGDIAGAHQGARGAKSVHLGDVLVSLPRGPGGPIQVDGPITVSGISAPEGTVASATVDLDMAFDPAKGEPLGKAHVDVAGIARPDGQRIDKVKLDAIAEAGGRIHFDGEAVKGTTNAKGETIVNKHGVTAAFTGTATLPGPKRALAVVVDSLRLRRPGDLDDFLVAQQVRYDASGWIALDDLVLRATRKAGVIELKGRFRPADGVVDATVAAHEVSIPSWIKLVDDALAWAGRDPLKVPDELGGELELSLRVTGTLARPDVAGKLDLGHLKWGDRTGAGAKATLRIGDDGIDVLAALQWHDGGNASLQAKLPARLSLAPAGLTWNDGAPMRLAASVDETDLTQVFDWVDALSMTGSPTSKELKQQANLEGLDGAFRFDLIVDGTPADPELRTDFIGHPLDIGKWKNGSLTFEGTAKGDASNFHMVLADSKERVQAMFDIVLPFGIARTLRKPDPVGWVRQQLEDKPFLVKLVLPRFVIAETPLVLVTPDNIADLAAEVDLSLSGTLGKPVAKGSIALTSPEASPVDLGFALTIGTSDTGTVSAYFSAARPNGDPLLDGTLSVPRLGDILQNPSTVPKLFDDPALSLDLESTEIASFDFWELSQSLGDLAVQLFPDGRVMLNVSAHGSPQGLIANVNTHIRTVTPEGVTPPALADSSTIRRNAADDVRLAVLIGPDDMKVALSLIQDARSVTPFFAVDATLKAGLKQVLAGTLPAVSAIPIEAVINAEEFRLEGVASAAREILGTSGGTLTGKLEVSNTLGAPHFAKSMVAQFQPIVVAPLGLHHDWATVTIEFTDATSWKLTVNELYDEARKTTIAPATRCGVTPLTTPVDYSENPYLTIGLKGTIPALDPKRMTIGGCVGLRDYPALDKSDMRGRVDGELTLSGTVAQPRVTGKLTTVEAVIAPKLATKTVRALGTPLDVTLVRGPPVPPPERPVRNPYKIGIDLDIEVVIPKDSVRLEPSLSQLYGEVRAVLYPSGTLHVRTNDGELGLVGTIIVPRDTVFLYGRTFTVDKDSKIVFTGDMVSDPQLFFTARYNIEHVDLSSIGLATTRDSEIVVQVTGTPTAPRLKFLSNPAMDETNILSVIALGVPAGGGGAVGEAVQAQLFTAVMGMATLQFARDFQQRLALDVLKIEARSADPTESRVTAGKNLTDKLIAYYYLDLAAGEGEDENAGSLEYRLTRYLSAIVRGGDSGDLGVELNLRFQE